MWAVYRFFFSPTQSRFSVLAAERIITLQEFKLKLSSFQTTILSDFYLKQRLRVSLWGFCRTDSVWSLPCLGFVFVTLTQLGWSRRRNVIWKNTPTRLSWKQVFRAFFLISGWYERDQHTGGNAASGQVVVGIKESLAEQARISKPVSKHSSVDFALVSASRLLP